MSVNDILINFALPILTALIAWYGNAYRNKQKKESDVLDNVQQIITMQKDYINGQNETLDATRKMLSGMQRKYDYKSASIRKAYNCTVPSEECPVLIHEGKIKTGHDCEHCENCEHNPNRQ